MVLDPGHNGGNGSHPKEINQSVPAGRGEMKPCNTTGTSTNAGYTEHAFNFDVANQVGKALSAKGIKVIYTRSDDSGVGPCVDRRAEIGNAANADAVVSIHADGSTSAGAHGFHVAYSSPPLNAAQGAPSTTLARALRDGLRSDGFTTSTYIGTAGLSPRSDLVAQPLDPPGGSRGMRQHAQRRGGSADVLGPWSRPVRRRDRCWYRGLSGVTRECS